GSRSPARVPPAARARIRRRRAHLPRERVDRQRRDCAAARMRANQKARTRQAIVRAAGALLARGLKPSLDEIAAEAKVSRATAYRYFPGLDALLSEAAVGGLIPDPGDLLGAGAPDDPFERLALVDDTFDRACREREAALRLMLARTL